MAGNAGEAKGLVVYRWHFFKCSVFSLCRNHLRHAEQRILIFLIIILNVLKLIKKKTTSFLNRHKSILMLG